MRKLAAGVIFNGDRYLLLKRKHNWKGWEFVKGNLDGESFKKALMREIGEETRLSNVRILCELPRDVVYKHRKIGRHRFSMQRGFLVESSGDNVKVSFEHSGYRWVTAKQARKMITFPSHRNFLSMAERERKKYKKDIIDNLSRKHATRIRFDGKYISLNYDRQKLKCRAVKKVVKDVGLWSKKRNIVYYDKNLVGKALLPILVHEVVEKYVSQKYNLDEDLEAHKVATAVEKEFVVDPDWISQQRRVATAWVKANKRKIGKAKFY